MKHVIITPEPGSARCKRAQDSMGGVAEYKTYDTSEPWPLRGFTRNVNEILREAAGEIVCIYNDDIAFEDFGRWVQRVEAAIGNGAGIVGPVQVSSEDPNSVIMGGVYEAFPGGIHKVGTRKDHCRDKQESVAWMPFCAVAFNPEAVTAAGLLDEQMAMWFSDSDWCIRSRLAGYPVILDRGVVILHDNHATTGAIEAGTDNCIRFYADMEAFRRKWGGDQLAAMS